MNSDVIIASIIKDITHDLIHTALQKDIDYGKVYETFSKLIRENAEGRTKNAGELADERKKIEMLSELKSLFDEGAIDSEEYEIMNEPVMTSESNPEKTVICEFCGMKFPEKLGVCPQCNGIYSADGNPEKKGVCPNCGSLRNPKKSICTKCGYKFKQ